MTPGRTFFGIPKGEPKRPKTFHLPRKPSDGERLRRPKPRIGATYDAQSDREGGATRKSGAMGERSLDFGDFAAVSCLLVSERWPVSRVRTCSPIVVASWWPSTRLTKER